MNGLQIRLAEPKDALSYQALRSAIFSENLNTLFPLASQPTPEEVERHVTRHDGQNSAIFLAEISGKLAGFLNLARFPRPQTDHTVGLGLNVAKDFRGKGIGRALLQRGIAWANETPAIERIELEVMQNNPAGIHLYESCGFVTEGIKRAAVKKPFGHVDVIIMGMLIKAVRPTASRN